MENKKVISVYDDKIGIVKQVIHSKSIQDFYMVLWEDNTISIVAREEIY